MTGWRSRLLVTLSAVLPVLSACAHDVRITSDPPGAEVFIEGERVGVTPMTWTETSSPEGRVTVALRQGSSEARFALKRDGIAPNPLIAGALTGVGSIALGTAMILPGYFAFAFGLVLGTVAPPLLLVSMGGLAVLLTGAVLLTLGTQLPFLVVSEAGRVSPDLVHVDFNTAQVTTSPARSWEDLVGVTPGYRPLDLSRDRATSRARPEPASSSERLPDPPPEDPTGPPKTIDRAPVADDDGPDESLRDEPSPLP